jgi:hypothetical protein
MSQLERLNDFQASLKAFIRAQILLLQTAMPVEIVDVSLGESGNLTATCQPTIKARVPTMGGGYVFVKLPLLIFVPIVIYGGGGYFVTCPIKKGDEGLCVFSSRSIDNWWAAGGVQNPIEIRNHDLSDGFVIVGPHSQANLVPNVSTTELQIRNLSGDTSISIGPLGAITIKAPLPGGVVIDGNLQVNGVITHTP